MRNGIQKSSPWLAAAVLGWCGSATAATSSENYAEIAAGRIFYTDSGGKGAAVVFLHPGSGNSLVFEKQLEPFSKAGFRVITFDRAGQGKSTAATATATGGPALNGAEIGQLMDHLGIRRFHLVGVAAGGGVGLQYALGNTERVISLTVANSIGNVQDASYNELGRRIRPREFNQLPVEMRELGPSYRAANPEGVQRWLQLSAQGARLPEPGAGAVANGGPRGAGGPPGSPPGSPPGGPPGGGLGGGPGGGPAVTFAALEKLSVPTLLITGDADMYTPPSVLRMFKAHMPRAEMVIIDEAGHASQWENPEVFNRTVLRFLRKHR